MLLIRRKLNSFRWKNGSSNQFPWHCGRMQAICYLRALRNRESLRRGLIRSYVSHPVFDDSGLELVLFVTFSTRRYSSNPFSGRLCGNVAPMGFIHRFHFTFHVSSSQCPPFDCLIVEISQFKEMNNGHRFWNEGPRKVRTSEFSLLCFHHAKRKRGK